MVKVATLGKIALGLSFPVFGMIYLTQNRIAKKFAHQTYYEEALKLLNGYKPIAEKLGEPLYATKIDLSDDFNYQDDKIARVRIPVNGQNASASLFVFASKNATKWEIDSLEILFKNSKFKFYDGNLVKKD